MKKNNNMIIIGLILLTMCIFIVIVGFIISKYFKTEDTINILGTIITFLSSSVTIVIAYLAFKLSGDTDKRESDNYNTEILKSASITYDYLIEIINKLRNTLTYRTDAYKTIEYKNEYSAKLQELSENVLTLQEVKYIREIYDSIKIYSDVKDADVGYNHIQAKWMYKSMFDLNISVSEIKKDYLYEKLEFLINLDLLQIIFKLKQKLKLVNNSEVYECKCQKIEISEIDGKINIYKTYNDEKYITNIPNISGNIKQYEVVFVYESDRIYFREDLIYDGQIENNEYNGEGSYHYYSISTFKSTDHIQSSELIKDKCAMQIREYLESMNIKTDSHAKFKGKFKNGLIKNGVLETESPEGTKKTLKIDF